MDDHPETILRFDEVILRPWQSSDGPALVEACQDPEIARWVDIPQPYLPADADALIESSLTMWRLGTGAAFAIVAAATGRLLGAVTRFGPNGHQATLGLWLVREARGRGVGTRALRLVTDWTFSTTSVVRVDCFIEVGNEPSMRMVERAGFQREGVLRAWDMRRNGVAVDCVVFSRLSNDI